MNSRDTWHHWNAAGALQENPLSRYGVDERLSWSSGRKATIEEDSAYFLLGLFGTHMPFIYGELEGTAFRRLQREISQLSEPDSYHSMAVSRIKSLEGHLRFVGNESAVANHPPRHGLHCHGHGREGRRSLLVPTLPEKCSTINAKRSCSRKHDTGPSTEAREKTSRDYIKWVQHIGYNVPSDRLSQVYGVTNA